MITQSYYKYVYIYIYIYDPAIISPYGGFMVFPKTDPSVGVLAVLVRGPVVMALRRDVE